MAAINGIADRIAEMAEQFNLVNLRPQIEACRRMLGERSRLDVAVFGRFKAGKSSFLNNLIGRAVLPVGVVPVTTIITRVRWGATAGAEVSFLNGSKRGIAVEEVGSYVGEKENPRNKKNVALVTVEVPEMRGWSPLEFVDTPGLGSALAHNTEAALNWMPNVGAALVAVSLDAPLSEDDLELIAQVRRHTPRTVLLLTKADLLSPGDREEVLSFVKGQLGEKGLLELPIYFHSVRPGFGGLRDEVETKLLRPLIQGHAQAVGEIARHKLVSVAGQMLDYLRIALAAATQTEAARQQLRRRLDEERRQLGLYRQELRVLANQWWGEALDWSLGELSPIRRSLQERITAELSAEMDGWRWGLPRVIREYGKWTREFLLREMAVVSLERRAVFLAPVEKAEEHFGRVARAFQDRLAGHVREALGLSVKGLAFIPEKREPEPPPVDVSLAFIVQLEILGYLIPMTVFGGVARRNLLRRARYEVEKNLSRLAAQWRDRAGGVIQEMRAQAESYMEEELVALEQILRKTPATTGELTRSIEEMEAMKSRMAI